MQDVYKILMIYRNIVQAMTKTYILWGFNLCKIWAITLKRSGNHEWLSILLEISSPIHILCVLNMSRTCSMSKVFICQVCFMSKYFISQEHALCRNVSYVRYVLCRNNFICQGHAPCRNISYVKNRFCFELFHIPRLSKVTPNKSTLKLFIYKWNWRNFQISAGLGCLFALYLEQTYLGYVVALPCIRKQIHVSYNWRPESKFPENPINFFLL